MLCHHFLFFAGKRESGKAGGGMKVMFENSEMVMHDSVTSC